MINKSRIIKWGIRLFLTVIIIGILLIISLFSINAIVKSSTKNKIGVENMPSTDSDYDCILVLGAGIRKDGSPSAMLEDRLLTAISLYNEGYSDRLLMSGDHGRVDYDEVNLMKKFAIDKGIPSEHIFMDHAGFSTYESIYRAKDIFKANKVLIVTQEYHLYRALYIAKHLGLNAHGVAADPRIYAGQDYRELREIAARFKDFFTVIIKPKPTYLGDAIPVSGNGDLTNDK